MTLEQFKAEHGIESIPLGQNPNTTRYIAETVSSSGKKLRIISKPTSEFSLEKTIFVYPTEVNEVDSDGVVIGKTILYVLSNKKGPKVVATI